MRLQLVVAVALVCLAGSAWADGRVQMRGAIYKERSTQVIQPMLDAKLDAGDATEVKMHVLVDSITSASAATGRSVEWTETRSEAGLGFVRDLQWLKFGAFGRYSTESDYDSVFVGVTADKEFFQKNFTVGLVFGRGFDSISNQVTLDDGAIGTPPREESLRTGLSSLSLSQLVSPNLVTLLTYDFMDSHGYHENIYRVVFGGVSPVEERVPEDRYRHAVYGGIRGYLPSTGTTYVAGYRFYADNWGITGHTPEARVVQRLADGLWLRGRYRLHTQGAADFYREVYTRAEIEDPDMFVTADEKLGELTTHLAGLKASVALRVFGVSGVWKDALIDFNLERLWQDTSFGNAWIGQLGFEIPLSY